MQWNTKTHSVWTFSVVSFPVKAVWYAIIEISSNIGLNVWPDGIVSDSSEEHVLASVWICALKQWEMSLFWTLMQEANSELTSDMSQWTPQDRKTHTHTHTAQSWCSSEVALGQAAIVNCQFTTHRGKWQVVVRCPECIFHATM